MQARTVQKTIGGVTFEDRFAHLQEDSAEALAWQWARSDVAQAAAEASPNYAPIRDRMLQLGGESGWFVPRKHGDLWFRLINNPDDTVVLVGETPDGPQRTLVSKNAISAAHDDGIVMLARMDPSPRGRYVAIVWGLNGDMTGRWSVYETATGRHVRDADGLMYSGARVAWLPDESGFWLDDRSADGLHRLRFVGVADGASDGPELVLPEALVGKEHSGLTLQIAPGGGRAVAVTEPHERIALIHLDLRTLEATPFLPSSFEGECEGGWIDDETYIARVSHASSRGRVVAVPAATSRDIATWRELVPEGEGFLRFAGVIAGKLYVGDMVDVSLRVRVFALDGTPVETLPLPQPGSAPSINLDRGLRPTDAFAINHATFTQSPVSWIDDPETGIFRQLGIPTHRLEGVVTEQRFATSRDGTRIPYFLVRREDLKRDAPQPTLVYAYGGFNSSQLPAFHPFTIPFIEAGGVYVQANLRGGGEYGKAWHDAGRLFNKRNTFDDLEAVAEALTADGISTPDRLAFMGGSNGGMLAGATIAHRPHLWRVVVPMVPVLDIMELLPITPQTAALRAIMYEDYGDTSEPEVARSVIKWSPYHNIRDGVAYPAVFQVFGEQDAGCMPFHGRKFTARLDEANIGNHPIHLRVWRNTGHGPTEPATIAAYNAEWLAFVMDQLGMTARGPRP